MIDEMRSAAVGSVVWDRGERSSVKGLHLKVQPSGKKSFYFYYRARSGQERRPKIGTLGEITLAEARVRAKALALKVAMGEDPKGVWDDQRTEQTVQELFERTFDDHWGSDRFKASGWARQVENFYNRNLKVPFGRLRLSEVTPLRLKEWQRKRSDHPYAANRSLEILSKMFGHAEELEWREQGSNPCRLVKAFTEKKRSRYATEEEIQKIAEILDGQAGKFSDAAIAFVTILLFTGSRPSAIERATWDELQEFSHGGETYGILTFKGKTTADSGEKEKVVIPPQAMKWVNKLPRYEGHTITGIKIPRKLWNLIKEEAQCRDLWARDLRRTFATVGMSAGVNMGQIGEVLNHKTVETTKVYAKLAPQQTVEAVTQIASRLDKIIQGTQAAKG